MAAKVKKQRALAANDESAEQKDETTVTALFQAILESVEKEYGRDANRKKSAKELVLNCFHENLFLDATESPVELALSKRQARDFRERVEYMLVTRIGAPDSKDDDPGLFAVAAGGSHRSSDGSLLFSWRGNAPKYGWTWPRFWPKESEQSVEVKIGFGTCRAITPQKKPLPFFGRGTEVIRGQCTVDVPLRQHHLQGPMPGRTHSRRLRVPTAKPGYTNPDGLEGSNENVVVFVHGYNTSMEASVETAAKMALDLRLTGFSYMCFCWPSSGGQALSALSYLRDVAAVEASESFFIEFLRQDGRLRGKSVHIVVHSMGSRLVLRALQIMVQGSELNLGTIIFCAPDVDRQMFQIATRSLSNTLPRCRFLLLASHADRALGASFFLHCEPRAGLLKGTDSFQTQGCPVFDLSDDPQRSWLGHGDYASSHWSLDFIRDVLNRGTNHDLREILNKYTSEGRLVEIVAGSYFKFAQPPKDAYDEDD